MARSGYTLPVFACASALGALDCLRDRPVESVTVNLVEPPELAAIPIEQAAKIAPDTALAITRSDPGDNLDLTRHTPVWAIAQSIPQTEQTPRILILSGEGIGKRLDSGGSPAIYAYAQRLLRENLETSLNPGESLRITLILPQGRQLAERTSNAAFGVVEGLSLLGTSGIAQPLSAPEQLAEFQAELREKAAKFPCLVFCIGENGLDLACKLGINPDQLLKTANWLGPLLASAGLLMVSQLLLFGYHGKLIKVAGGIFHTHHHLADARQEILTARGAALGLPNACLQQLLTSPTVEAALQWLREQDAQLGNHWVRQLYQSLAQEIDRRSQDYIHKQANQTVQVGSVLFDRQRQIIQISDRGAEMLAKLCYPDMNIPKYWLD